MCRLWTPAGVCFDVWRRPAFSTHIPSLLPAYRGASPIQGALLEGAAETGVTLIRLVRSLDAGPIVAVERTAIDPHETAADLHARLSELTADMLVRVLPGWATGELAEQPQDESRVSLTRLLERADAELDLRRPARELYNRWRAFRPWPGARVRAGDTLCALLQVGAKPRSPGCRRSGYARRRPADRLRRGERSKSARSSQPAGNAWTRRPSPAATGACSKYPGVDPFPTSGRRSSGNWKLRYGTNPTRWYPSIRDTARTAATAQRGSLIVFIPFFDPFYLLLIGPAFILAMWAQSRVKGTYSKYSQVMSSSGIPAHMAARRLLDAVGLYNVEVKRVPGELTDHYDPTKKVPAAVRWCVRQQFAGGGGHCRPRGWPRHARQDPLPLPGAANGHGAHYHVRGRGLAISCCSAG